MSPRLLASLCAFGVLCGESFAANPQLTTVLPRGWQRGTEKELTFTGANLGDAQEVLVYYPGVAVKSLKVINPTTLAVAVSIAPDCRLGEHAVRVRTATGVTPLRTFWVGALPCVEEVEPNDTFDKPQPITLNTTVHGVIGNEDVDSFAVECKKGQRLSVELEGMRLGDTFWDPAVAVLDAKRFELATSDDSPLLGQDPGCSVVIPADGRYVVQVREAAYRGDEKCRYRLHVGTFPRPTAVVPAGGRPGEEIELRFVGDPVSEIRQRIRVPVNPGPHWRLHCQTVDGVSPTGFPFRVTDLPNVVESGANATPAGATGCSAPGAFNGVVGKPGEVDHFKFPARKGEVFDLKCYARRLGSPLDAVLTVSRGGKELAANDDSRGPDSELRFAVPEDGEYVAAVRDHLHKGGADYFYRVEITPIAPTVTMFVQRADLANLADQERQAVAVPKGGRAAALLVADRHDCGGPLVPGFTRLPAGVSLAADAMDPAQGVVPVVLEAAADAPVGGGLAAVTARHGGGVLIGSDTGQEAAFTVGPNQGVFARHVADKTAVAVTEACPYRIDVVEPAVPVPQGAGYNLRVVATRSAGFTGPINVHPLWQPPGVGIAGSATIPAGATEATLALNAAPNAAPRRWRTALQAVATVGDGPVWTSSQLFAVEVAPAAVSLAMERPAVEQGGRATLFTKVTVHTPFAGAAKVALVGLPPKVTAPELEITTGTTELAFPLTAEPGAPAGKHGGVFARITLVKNGEPVYQSAGGTELRVDVPLKAAAPPANVPSTPTPAAPPKRLTRLEQLRLEQEEREKAAGKPMR